MTRRQTGIIMDILSTAYPQFYAGADAPDPAKTVALWAEMFAEDDVVMVAAAVGSGYGRRNGSPSGFSGLDEPNGELPF